MEKKLKKKPPMRLALARSYVATNQQRKNKSIKNSQILVYEL